VCSLAVHILQHLGLASYAWQAQHVFTKNMMLLACLRACMHGALMNYGKEIAWCNGLTFARMCQVFPL
jgi:hypothetical protein